MATLTHIKVLDPLLRLGANQTSVPYDAFLVSSSRSEVVAFLAESACIEATIMRVESIR
jgi:hypothetical protein